MPALRDFFVQYFHFTVLAAPAPDKFVVLRDDAGFILNLMQAKESPEESGYPRNFHIGFFVDTPEQVRAQYAALNAAGIRTGDMEELRRGGFSSVTFYCHAPGGLLVEVSSQS